jgi:TolB-like protein
MIYRKLVVLLLALAVAGAAFAKDNLAVLPFTGGTEEEGETIAELFSFNRELNAVFAPIPRTSITRAVNSEQKFQTETGMTDPDTIMAIGKQLGAKYVVAGNIGKLGNQNLLIISILKIDDLRQVAGDMQTYMNIREIQGKLPSMAQNIIEATKIDASQLEKLAVTPVDLGRNIDAQVADTLAQVLSINLIRSKKFAVYPRTKTLEQVQAEYDNQGSGITADENMVDIGKGENPRLALSVAARRLGDQNMFNAAIISLESGVQTIGGSVDYQSLNDGITTMESLARKLTTTPLSLSLAESLTWISRNAVDGGNYTITLKNNETIAPQSLSYSGKNVSVTLDGGSAERTVRLSSDGSLFIVGNKVILTLGNNVSLQGRNSNTNSLVQVNREGTLVMESGAKIRGNSKTSESSYGGGMYVYGTFMMSGGAISGNSVSKSGGGVFVASSGTFTMSGGTISDNYADTGNGGGVYVDYSGTFTLSGGTISGNSASRSGGGVYVNGMFTMNNGTISDNHIFGGGGNGGGVFVSGAFTMNDGTISGNGVNGEGGGVDVGLGGMFTMSGGEISGNPATYYSGGGVCVIGGTFTMRDGTISGNTATGDGGGGVYVFSGTFTMSGGEISGNSATGDDVDGGGVCVIDGTFTKQAGGVIYGSDASDTLKNTATDGEGHAVYVYIDDSSDKKRNSTAGVGVRLDSTKDGAAGGWE